MNKVKMIALLTLLLATETTGLVLKKNSENKVIIPEEAITTTEVTGVTQVAIEDFIVAEEEPEEDIQEVPTYYGLTEDELNLVYAVVMQEGGHTYESAEYVMSTIVNRVNNPDKWSWAGDTIIEQIKYPQQYCYSLDDYWVKYLDGNVPDTVKNAVKSVIEFGPVHDYDCFRGYYLEDCEQVADNWYFVG